MSKTINIDDDVYARLERQALDGGVTVAEVIDRLSLDTKNGGITLALERMRGKRVVGRKGGSTCSARVQAS